MSTLPDPQTTSGTEPLTITANGAAPKNRFISPAGLWGSYQRSLQLDSINDVRMTEIRGIYDGFPPDSMEDLEEQGMSNMPNINTKEFQGKVDTYVSSWINYDVGGEKMMEFAGEWKENPLMQAIWNSRVTMHANRALCEWDCHGGSGADYDVTPQSPADYLMEAATRNTQMGLFGIGLMHWRDSIDWRPVAVPTRKVHVPRGTKVTLRNCQMLFIEEPHTPTQLWECVGLKTQEEAKKDGWNRDAVMKLLYERTAETLSGANSRELFSDWENRMRNNNTFYSSYFEPVYLIHCYVQEFAEARQKNGISHHIISAYGSLPLSQTPSDDEVGWLFFKDREYRSYKQVIGVFQTSTGPEGDWHGVKGFGDLIYDGQDLNNRLFNNIARGATMSCLPMWKASGANSREKMSQTVMTPMGILGPDLNLEQMRVQPDIGSSIEVLTDSRRTINQNTRLFPQGEVEGAPKNKTATQSTFDRQDQAQFTGLQIRYYITMGLDQMWAEIYRRLAAAPQDYPETWGGGYAAKNFRDRCEADKIPPEFYRRPVYVRASRTGSSGNASLDVLKAKEVLNVATPGQGQISARKELVAALYQDWTRVSEFIQDPPEADPTDVQVSTENAILTAGQLMSAFPFQDHLRHLGDGKPGGQGHLSLLADARGPATQMMEQGLKTNIEDAQTLSRTMDAALQHSSQHLQFMMSVPMFKDAVKLIQPVLMQFNTFVQQFDKALAKAMQDQAQQNGGLTVEDQMKLQRSQILAQADAQLKLESGRLDMQLKTQAHNQKLGQLATTHDLRSHIESEKAAQDFNQERTKHLQELGQEAENTLVERQINLASHNVELNQEQQRHVQEMKQSQDLHELTRAKHNEASVIAPE